MYKKIIIRTFILLLVVSVFSSCVTKWDTWDYQPIPVDEMEGDEEIVEATQEYNAYMEQYKGMINSYIEEHNAFAISHNWWAFTDIALVTAGTATTGAFVILGMDSTLYQLPISGSALAATFSTGLREAIYAGVVSELSSKVINAQMHMAGFQARFNQIRKDYGRITTDIAKMMLSYDELSLKCDSNEFESPEQRTEVKCELTRLNDELRRKKAEKLEIENRVHELNHDILDAINAQT